MHESYVVPPYEKGKCKHRALSIGEAGFRAFDATGTRDVTDTSQAFTQTLAGWILVPALVGLRVVWPPSLTPTPSSCYCAKPRENILASGSGSSGMHVCAARRRVADASALEICVGNCKSPPSEITIKNLCWMRRKA